MSMESDKRSHSRSINVPSKVDNLYEVQDFVDSCLSGSSPSPTTLLQLQLVVEEIFINIANYAYRPPGSGDVSISCAVEEDMMKVTLTFVDYGPEFDPLKKPDPDIGAPLDDRDVGGLGIYLVKNHVDGIHYRRDNGKNILTVEKFIS